MPNTANHLDEVWEAMSTGDRIVLLGHERNYLDDADRVRLTALIAAKANRTATPRGGAPRAKRAPRRARTQN